MLSAKIGVAMNAERAENQQQVQIPRPQSSE
jgi:hypothetical protein